MVFAELGSGDAEMYFDASYSDPHSLLCVAGYLFRKENYQELETEWKYILDREELPYFRMVDCAHGNGVFKGFGTPRCAAVQIELFELLKKHMEVGVSMSFDMRFRSLCPSAKYHGIAVMEPYTLCAYFCMMQGRKWASENDFKGKIAYLYESGDEHSPQANHLMNEVFDVPELCEHYRYGGHDFIPKASAAGLQCGDILAWQWTKFIKDKREGKRKPRADLLSLLERPHFTIHFNKEVLTMFNQAVQATNSQIEMKKTYAFLAKLGLMAGLPR